MNVIVIVVEMKLIGDCFNIIYVYIFYSLVLLVFKGGCVVNKLFIMFYLKFYV